MRNVMHGLCLSGVALSLVACSTTREPHVVIAPSYSYVQADLAAGILPTEIADASRTQPTVAKLPPTPAAPGFDTLVFVGTDQPTDP